MGKVSFCEERAFPLRVRPAGIGYLDLKATADDHAAQVRIAQFERVFVGNVFEMVK